MADYLAGQRRIFDDPPRWDYRVVGGFEEPTSLAWFSRQRTVPDWVTAAPNLGNPDRLAYVLALTVGWLSAMVTAMERAAGASADDAEDWAVTQQRAAEEFAARGAEGLQRVREAALALQRRRGIERIPELPPLIEDREFSTDEILAQTVFFLLDERELGRALAALSAEA
jgi:hypothetical protein